MGKELNAWIESREKIQNLDKINTAYLIATQEAQRKNSRDAIAAIRGVASSALLEKLEGQLRFFDNHLSNPPQALSKDQQNALFSVVHELSESFGPSSYMAVYREWKNSKTETSQK